MIKLRTYCQRRGAPAPSDQVVFEALNNLLAKRILGLTSEYSSFMESLQSAESQNN